MVKLSIDLIARGTSGYTKKKRDEDMDQYLKRLTHLYLEGKSIDEVVANKHFASKSTSGHVNGENCTAMADYILQGEDLTLCKNLSVLYLYDNKVERIPDLSQNYCLTHLYLQNNKICEMSNLNLLRKLTKLYLGGNSITVVEGIDKLELLEELHIENQRLPAGEKLLFDPRSLQAISTSLKVINVSGNNLDSVKEFSVIQDLQQFFAADNNLNNLKELSSVLGHWKRLNRLDLEGNPFCLKAKYRDRVIVMSNSLDVLDGKEISPTSRKFLQNWQASKAAQKKKKEEMDLNGSGDMEYPSSYGLGSADLAGRSNLNKISSYVMPGLPRRQFEEVLAKSSANLPSTVPYTAPAIKHYGSQPNFVSSPSSLGKLQRHLMEHHRASSKATPRSLPERAKSHNPRQPATIHF